MVCFIYLITKTNKQKNPHTPKHTLKEKSKKNPKKPKPTLFLFALENINIGI